MMHRKLLRGGAWLTASNAFVALAGFARNVAIARLVSVEDFGVVIMLSLALSAFETISNLAVDRLLVQSPDGDAPELQATAHALQVVRGILGGVVLYALAPWVATLFKIPHALWALHMLALVPVTRSLAHLDTVRFQREMLYRPTFWMTAVPQAISLVLAIPLAYWLRDYSALVWAMLAQALAQTAASHVLASRPYRLAWDRGCVTKLLAFGWPLLLNGLLILVIYQGDKAVIAAAFSPDVVGWYGAAFMLTMAPAMFAITILQSLLLPVLSRYQNQPEVFVGRYHQVMDACLAAGLMTAAIFAVMGPELLTLVFGGRYSEGATVVVFLGVTQGVRIAKAGQFVAAIALARTTDPLIANIGRGMALVAAIGLVALGYGPIEVAMMALMGEIVSYAVAMYLLEMRLKTRSVQQFFQMAVWIGLAVLSWFVGQAARGQILPLWQFMLGQTWLIFVLAVFLGVSPSLRAGLSLMMNARR